MALRDKYEIILKVFGIGLSRTGTTSLTRALAMLGYRAIHAPRSILEIEAHDAATDQFVAERFADLDIRFPKSKFILTRRDMESWLKSAEWTAARVEHAPTPEKERLLAMRLRIYGVRFFEETAFKRAHEHHVESVRNHFSKDGSRLLEMNICAGDGWAKLCPFLEKGIPQEAFPNLNARSR